MHKNKQTKKTNMKTPKESFYRRLQKQKLCGQSYKMQLQVSKHCTVIFHFRLVFNIQPTAIVSCEFQ